MKFFILFFLLVAQGAWGGTVASETTFEAAFPDSLGSLPASFIGDLPCASCSGIRYQIDLFPDRVFFRHMTYLGESKSLDAIGIWNISPDSGTLILKEQSAAPELYAIKDQSTIRKLDLDGHEIESVLNYDLKRTASFQPIEPQVATASLENTYWKLLQLGDKPVVVHEQQREPHFVLRSQDHRVGGSGGCNRLMGGYELEGGKLVFTQIATTMMACAEGMDTEQAFLAALAMANGYKQEPQQLTLLDASGNALATFAAQSSSLGGTSWHVTGYNNGKQAVVSVIIGSKLTADFKADGSLGGSAGCNGYAATYTTSGKSIKIDQAAATRKMCAQPEGVMGQEAQYLKALSTAATYRLEGNRLELRTADGALAVTLSSAGNP